MTQIMSESSAPRTWRPPPLVRSVARLVLRLRRPWLRRWIARLHLETVQGIPLVILPDVHSPVVFRSGSLLAEAVLREGRARGNRVRRALDLGTGSGVGAVFLARVGFNVVAVDVAETAVRCARINALLNGVDDRVSIRQGDLYAPVAGERFDLITFNPPFFVGDCSGGGDVAWRAADVLQRFAAGLPGALTPDGYALVVFSTDGDGEAWHTALRAHRLVARPALRRDFLNELMTVYRVTPEGK